MMVQNKKFKPFLSLLSQERQAVYDKYFINVWAASEFPYVRKSQETFMKVFLRGNFSLRKCAQSSVHQPLSGLGTFCQAQGGTA